MDKHLSWIDHNDTLENKLSKKLELLYKARPFLNAKAMKSIYCSFFHSYLLDILKYSLVQHMDGKIKNDF